MNLRTPNAGWASASLAFFRATTKKPLPARQMRRIAVTDENENRSHDNPQEAP